MSDKEFIKIAVDAHRAFWNDGPGWHLHEWNIYVFKPPARCRFSLIGRNKAGEVRSFAFIDRTAKNAAHLACRLIHALAEVENTEAADVANAGRAG